MTVAKLRGARDRKRRANSKCEGRKSLAEMYPGVVREAKRLARANPKTGKRRSLRKIAAELAKIGEALEATETPGAEEAGELTSLAMVSLTALRACGRCCATGNRRGREATCPRLLRCSNDSTLRVTSDNLVASGQIGEVA